MGLTENVSYLAVKDNELRRKRLKEVLDSMGVKFVIDKSEVESVDVENIRVIFNKDKGPKLIFGAHYDTFTGSPGANDNASGVSILLGVLEELQRNKPKSHIEIVFFDHEEAAESKKGLLGSKHYLEKHSNADIKAMINLDICGVGDIITMAPKKNLEDPLLIKITDMGSKFNLEFLDQLPQGDDYFFEKNSIPNLSICLLPEKDIEDMKRLFAGDKDAKMPAIVETMHNGPRDNIEVISEEDMSKLLEWVLEFIKLADI